jgi:hypothetical protein
MIRKIIDAYQGNGGLPPLPPEGLPQITVYERKLRVCSLNCLSLMMLRFLRFCLKLRGHRRVRLRPEGKRQVNGNSLNIFLIGLSSGVLTAKVLLMAQGSLTAAADRCDSG